MDLNGILNKIKEELDEKDKRREQAFIKSRKIRRLSTKAIREIHKDNFSGVDRLIKEAKKEIDSLDLSECEFGFLGEALQEYCEAILTLTFIKKEKVPSPEKLGISAEAYVMGLADSVGELRRYILDAIRKDNFEDAEYFLDLMDEICHEIATFDYPNAILPVRRKQDMARAILEKTRGDVTLALKLSKLEKNIGE